MKNKIKTLMLSGLLLLILVSFMAPVSAKNTSCTLTLNCSVKENNKDRAVSGDTFAIVKIADVSLTKSENDYNLSYKTLQRFKDFDCPWTKLSSSDMRVKSNKLAENVTKRDYVDIKTTDKNGRARFNLKENGLYLVIRIKTENAKVTYEPSLISLPQIIDGKLKYNVVSTPKLRSKNNDNYGYQGDLNDGNSASQDNDNGTRLPQTGQLILPVVLLFIIGIPMIIIGVWLLKSGKKKDEN